MKMKLVYTMALAAACALASTGCRHTPGQITKLPGPEPLTPPTPPISGTLGGGENANPQPSPTEFYNGMAMDRAALAAYTIHFAYDSAAIRRSENANLQAVAQQLQSNPGTKLLIEGNCDERGTEEYNRALGERRADAARNALIKLGISGDRIMTKSFGKDNPVAMGHDEASRAQNRRDDFVLLHPANGAAPMGMGGS
jgi:peptidoglycan-associated lipoprotein